MPRQPTRHLPIDRNRGRSTASGQTTVSLLIDRRATEEARTVLGEIGISLRDAVELLFRQIAIRHALPFSLAAARKTAPGSARTATHRRTCLGRSASLCADPDGFFVLAGSRIVPRRGRFAPRSAWAARREHAEDVDGNGIVVRDIRFDTISGAACFVYGGNANGNVFWHPVPDPRGIE